MCKGETGGKETGKATYRVLREWGILEQICCCSFDTTAVNTGHLTAAIVTLQYDLNKALLWLACRHHIFEVVLDHVCNYLQIEDTASPEYTVFKRFRSVFNALSSGNN